MTHDPLGFYQILELSPEADANLVKIHYRDLAKICHPDHNASPTALEDFQKLSIAYDTLKNTKSRTIYGLLSLVYTADDFPDMKNLKIYKDVKGEENPFLRVFKLYRIQPSWKKGSESEQNLIGNFDDAQTFIREITRHNWLKGWWSPTSFKANIKALKHNYQNINLNYADNLKLLIHNAAAYYSLDKLDKAYLSAKQALMYATPGQTKTIEDFLSQIPVAPVLIPIWDFAVLKKIQLKIPFISAGLIAFIFLVLLAPLGSRLFKSDEVEKIAYYQEVRFTSGDETVDDVVVSKIFNIPVDTTDTKMLYHTTAEVNIMYGPSAEFDIMTTARLRQTVRVTGYTPDQEWYRVMLDNGEMGFIRKENLKPGMGRDIPENSKIFQNPFL